MNVDYAARREGPRSTKALNGSGIRLAVEIEQIGRPGKYRKQIIKTPYKSVGAYPISVAARLAAPILARHFHSWKFCRTKASILMESPNASPRMPANYYRREADRVRRLANEATTPAIKTHLRGVAEEYERLAQRVEWPPQPGDETAE